MLSTQQSGMAKAAVLLLILFIFEAAAPTRVFGCPILLGGRHRGCAAPCGPPCSLVIPSSIPTSIPAQPVLQPTSSFSPPHSADESLLEDVDAFTLEAIDTELPTDGGSAASMGAIGGIRPTGFLPLFWEPALGGAFAPGLASSQAGFPGGSGGEGGLGGRSRRGFGLGGSGLGEGLLGGSTGGSGSSPLGPFGGGTGGLPGGGTPGSGSGGDPGGNGGDPSGGPGGGDPIGNGSGPDGSGPPNASTPEPATLILACIGIVGLIGMAWRQSRRRVPCLERAISR